MVSNEIIGHHDWMPTFLAAAGDPAVKENSRGAASKPGGKTFKVHLDGYNLLPYLTGKEAESPRRQFIYFDDDGQLVAMRAHNWKMVFLEQRCEGTLRIWAEPFTALRVPKLFNLRTDPFELADVTSNTYYEWFIRHAYFMYYIKDAAAEFVMTFAEFPPAQHPDSFTIDDALAKLSAGAGAGAGEAH